ncbi:MAG: hypothetical protein J6U75_04110, partial [Clostridia bacterium]|nr:hypothetical protein [Clostridia bacterium]
MKFKDLKGRKARMLLVYPDYTDRSVAGSGGGNYSEGLASISAVLKEGGHDCKLYHLKHYYDENEYKEGLLALGEFDV